MAFQIGFGHHIYSCFITHIIPWNLIWIMTCPDCINMILLEKHQVNSHFFFCNASSFMRFPFMSINTCQNQPLSIQINNFSYNFKSSKANCIRYNFYQTIILISYLQAEIIKIWLVMIPRSNGYG